MSLSLLFILSHFRSQTRLEIQGTVDSPCWCENQVWVCLWLLAIGSAIKRHFQWNIMTTQVSYEFHWRRNLFEPCLWFLLTSKYSILCRFLLKFTPLKKARALSLVSATLQIPVYFAVYWPRCLRAVHSSLNCPHQWEVSEKKLWWDIVGKRSFQRFHHYWWTIKGSLRWRG